MAINTYKYLKSVVNLVNHKLKRNGSDIVLSVNRENEFYHLRDNKGNLCHGGASSKSCVTFLRGIEYTLK